MRPAECVCAMRSAQVTRADESKLQFLFWGSPNYRSISLRFPTNILVYYFLSVLAGFLVFLDGSFFAIFPLFISDLAGFILFLDVFSLFSRVFGVFRRFYRFLGVLAEFLLFLDSFSLFLSVKQGSWCF